jgi:recombination protein RecT
MTDQPKSLAISNHDKIKALAHNQKTIERFTQMLGSKREALAYITSAMLAVANSPDLMECTPSSVFNSVMRAAALRLYCDPALRQAYPVPFNNKVKGRNGEPDRWIKQATLIIGYIGLNNLAARTGKYRYLNASELYEGQTIEVNQLTGAAVIKGTRKSDKVIGYFHYFELLKGLSHTYYMPVEDLKAHGERYAPKNPLWKSAFPDMAKKTVTRTNLLKFGILDPSDRAVIDEMSEDRPEGEAVNTIDGEFTEIDDELAEQAAAEEYAEPERKAPADAYRELTGEDMPADQKKKVEPDDPQPEPLRYQPEQLKARLAEIAKSNTEKLTNGKKGLVVTVLEACLSHTTDPSASRKQLLVYLVGKDSTNELSDNEVMALYRWLAPTKNETSGEWFADAMSEREAIAAFNACQPGQAGLF